MEYRMWPNENGSVNFFAELEKKVYFAFSNCGLDAWFLVDIDPVGFSNEKVRMASVISSKYGVLTLSIHEENSIEQFLPTVDLYTNMIEEKIYNLLLESAALIMKKDNKKVLKFPYYHMDVFYALENKSQNVMWRNNNRKVWYVLFSLNGYTPELEEFARIRKNLILTKL
jgi:hypothetical protein